MSHIALHGKFKKWRQMNKDLFLWAVSQALTLHATPERISTHGLLLIVSPNPTAGDSTPPEQCFRLHSHSVEPISELRLRLSEAAEAQHQFNTILGERSDELRAHGGLGWAIILMVLLELPWIERPTPYVLPMGFMEKPELLPDPNWYDFLAGAVEHGWSRAIVMQEPRL